MFVSDKAKDNNLRSKLKIVKRILKLRGVPCTIYIPNQVNYQKVHGYSFMDVEGDYSSSYSTIVRNLVINLNELDPTEDKSQSTQIIYHYERILEKDYLVKYSNEIYEFMFKVTDHQIYGERNTLHQYELSHLKTIKK